MSTVEMIIAISSSLPGVAAVIAVCRAKPEDLPDVVRALMRTRRRKRKRKGDNNPKPLPDS